MEKTKQPRKVLMTNTPSVFYSYKTVHDSSFWDELLLNAQIFLSEEADCKHEQVT